MHSRSRASLPDDGVKSDKSDNSDVESLPLAAAPKQLTIDQVTRPKIRAFGVVLCNTHTHTQIIVIIIIVIFSPHRLLLFDDVCVCVPKFNSIH